MRFAAQVLLLAASASFLGAQTPFEIRGTVSERGLGPIAGAEVQAYTRGPTGAPQTVVTAFTDGRGQFLIRTATPGLYALSARLEGYAPAAADSTPNQVDADHPRIEASLFLIRPAQAIGHVLDAETREPVEGVVVSAVRRYSSGSASWVFASSIPPLLMTAEQRVKEMERLTSDLKTKPDGTFKIQGLLPGDYAATVADTTGSLWSSGYSAEDLKVIEKGDEQRFWPGGVPEDAIRYLSLGSGAVVSFGDILLKKTPLYRAHVSLAQGDCPGGESMRVTLFRKGGQKKPQMAAFPCGSELLLRRLEPASYGIYAVSDWQGERENIEYAVWATAQFEIKDENTEITLTPQHGVILEGRLVAADNAVKIPDSIPLGVQPEEFAPGMKPDREQLIEWLDDGAFRMAISPRTQEFGRRFQREGAYVSQLRYNGIPLPDLKVPVNPGAGAQRLDIVLDNKFGQLEGTVAGAPPQSLVVLWEGSTRNDVFPITNGGFRAGPLIPGEYRVNVTSPQVALGMVTTTFDPAQPGERVTIRANETTTIRLGSK